MREWQTSPLDECLDTLLDYRGKSPPKSEIGIPVLSAKVVKTTGLLRPIEQKIASDYYPKWMVRGLPHVGDVVMTTEAPMGEVIQLDEETVQYALGQRIVCMRGKPNKLDNTFLRYLLTSPAQQAILASYATGTTVLGISQKALRSVPITYPVFRQQQWIGELLGALDDKIELNRRMNKSLEAMTQAIFKDWFVDFGPTRAKMEGRRPYLGPDIWSLFPDRLDDEGRPEGWKKGKLADFMSFQGGTQPPANEFVDAPRAGYVRLLQIRDYYSTAHKTYIPDTHRLRKVKIDDICIGRYGSGTGDDKDSLGRLCRGLEGAINVALVKVQPLFKCREWLATYIGSGDFRRAISGGSARAVQAGFRQEDLSHILIATAPAALYGAFEDFASISWEEKKQILSENEAVSSLRNVLLPKLMSGEVRVREAEHMVSGAT